jgi:hypothetical protein
MPDNTQVISVESVDRIRDIIFGPKMRDYEQRFDAILRDLDRLQQELDHLGDLRRATGWTWQSGLPCVPPRRWMPGCWRWRGWDACTV